MPNFELKQLGWDEWFESRFEELNDPEAVPVRICIGHRGSSQALSESGEVTVQPSGKMLHDAFGPDDLPVVGDWVSAHPSDNGPWIISSLLPRRTSLSRSEDGGVQMLAANVDLLFVVTALTSEFNIHRLERYATIAWEGGVEPVIVLNKTDLMDPVERATEVALALPGIRLIATSTLTGDGIDELSAQVQSGRTVALMGSSGVGKTSLVNAFTGDTSRRVNETREDDRGRHTTTARELLILDSGGILIDTPGIREVQVGGSEGVDQLFSDVVELQDACRFGDCAHKSEPGCAILSALEDGSLTDERWSRYLQMMREAGRQGRTKKAKPQKYARPNRGSRREREAWDA